MDALGWLERFVGFLGDGAGAVLFGIALFVAAPFVDRLLVRRKRLGFRVLYNSKIGIGPERLHDGADPADSGPRQLRQVVRLLDRMSVVVIRIRNSGSYDIDPEDFAKPLSFTFGGRVVWNARISEASNTALREELRNALRFFADDGRAARDNLLTVRGRLAERMGRLLRAPTGQDAAEPHWYGVWMDGLSLRRGQKAKLVVVLREPPSNYGDEITKDLAHGGRLKDNGLIKDEGDTRSLTLPRVSGALAALLTIVLVVSQIAARSGDPTVGCASGHLRVEGSSAFMPALVAIRDEYVKTCGDARIDTLANGSLDGVRDVGASAPGQSPEVVALSDGKSLAATSRLRAQKVAIVVFKVVVNRGVGLTTIGVEDLRKIYKGTWTNWNQVPGAKAGDLPIRIVGRGYASGTREVFEKHVLGFGEPSLTSDDCLAKTRPSDTPVIRCEQANNQKVIEAVAKGAGAIGYADLDSIRKARQDGAVDNAITALTLDGQEFDYATSRPGYPYWTVEYLYTVGEPKQGSLTDAFFTFVRGHSRLGQAGFAACPTPPQPSPPTCDLR
ncbi:substrate-binding domain-containing protein [Sphaerisporangium sp. NPDC051017]|uniref:substrate-binding domain-containing protein n=1 Tax=Sphaerisporangium sp. NPDC051017 TaxID=3154636 RepID=UPI00343C2CA6